MKKAAIRRIEIHAMRQLDLIAKDDCMVIKENGRPIGKVDLCEVFDFLVDSMSSTSSRAAIRRRAIVLNKPLSAAELEAKL